MRFFHGESREESTHPSPTEPNDSRPEAHPTERAEPDQSGATAADLSHPTEAPERPLTDPIDTDPADTDPVDSHPEAVRSDPVPVPRPAADDTDLAGPSPDAADDDAPVTSSSDTSSSEADTTADLDHVEAGRDHDEEAGGPAAEPEAIDRAIDDQGTFTDPVVVEHPDPQDGEEGTGSAEDHRDAVDSGVVEDHPGGTDHGGAEHLGGADVAAEESGGADVAADESKESEPPFHEPPEPLTAFGAATVGGAVAASALAGRTAADDPDRGDQRSDHDVQPDRNNVASQDSWADRDSSHEGRAEDVALDNAKDTPAPSGATAVDLTEVPLTPAVSEESADLDDAADDDDRDDPDATDAPVELLPSAVPEQPVLVTFFDSTVASDFRVRWREVQLHFVDDPQAAASDARALVDEVAEALTTAVTARKDELGGWQSQPGETEQLRVVVRRYRDFLDRVLGL